MNSIKKIARSRKLWPFYESLDIQIPELINLILKIQQIPSPTFNEHQRAKFVENSFNRLGLENIKKDALNNVYGRLPGSGDSARSLVVTAHIDTVFSAETDLTVKEEENFLFGPGVGDNAAGVAAIITLAKIIKQFQLPLKSDLWFVANVCEEGLGDLRGMRAVVERFGRSARYIVVEGGSFGQVIHKAIGVKRFRIAINTPGGHSWGNFGEPNAIHEISHVISKIDKIQVPSSPKTTFNVGVIKGGTTVNSIASAASMLLDIRSEDKDILNHMVDQVKSIIEKTLSVAAQKNKKVTIEVDQVGDRPAGCLGANDDLVVMAEEALRAVGWTKISNDSGSTDANIPISKGISAVCVGLTTSGNSHRLDEFIELQPMKKGLQQLLLLVLAASNY